jgi:hypothetical protein
MKPMIGICGLAVLLLAGCKSVEERIGEQSDRINTYLPELTANPLQLPERTLDWETAVSMLDSNLVMRNANEEVVKAEVAVNRVFLDLIPQLTVQGIYSQAVTQFTELSSENFNANINALFAIPGLLKLRMEYYAAMLACYKARQQYDLAYREEVVNLYSLFRQYRQMQENNAIDTLKSAQPLFSSAERMELEFRRKQRETELWLGLSAALGCYSNHWNVVGDQLPQFDYLADAPDWNNPEEVGKLFTNLQAVELEGTRLRELGIKFQYWPQLNMRIYSPSVYLVSGGDRGGFEFDAEDIRFEASVRMKLDTNLQIRDQLREARRSTTLLKQKLYEDAQERTKKILDAHAALAIVEIRHRQLLAQEQLLKSGSRADRYDAYEKRRAERIQLMTDRLALEKELDAIVPILWMADERKWTIRPVP